MVIEKLYREIEFKRYAGYSVFLRNYNHANILTQFPGYLPKLSVKTIQKSIEEIVPKKLFIVPFRLKLT
jgi:hypothetical protein